MHNRCSLHMGGRREKGGSHPHYIILYRWQKRTPCEEVFPPKTKMKYVYINAMSKMMVTSKNIIGWWPNASNHHSSPKFESNISSLVVLDFLSWRSSKVMLALNPSIARLCWLVLSRALQLIEKFISLYGQSRVRECWASTISE